MAQKPHKNLDLWKHAITLTVNIYDATLKLPDTERFGLISQMRRAAVSVPSNIAEGAARNTKKEFLQFLYTSRGSLSELDTQLVICKELRLLPTDIFTKLTEDIEVVSKLMSGLIKSLKKQNI